MPKLFTDDELIHFLLHAKRQVYALRGDRVSMVPLLPGSKQLEYYEAPFFYRDIYCGMTFFVGQEIVYFREQPIWSMSYSGGIILEAANPDEMPDIYVCLRQALCLVTYERPFRGPQRYLADPYRYLDATQGDIARFCGEEMIMRASTRVYELRYSGGLLG